MHSIHFTSLFEFLFSLGVTATSDYLLKMSDFAPIGAGWPKISGRWGRPTNHSSQKTRLNDLSYGIKIWADFSPVLSQFTCLTDGQTEFSSLDHVCIPCTVVKSRPATGEHREVVVCFFGHRVVWFWASSLNLVASVISNSKEVFLQ